MTHPAHRKVGQKRGATADFHQFSENDEGEHEVHDDLQYQTGNAVIIVIQIVDCLGRRVDRGLEHTRQIVADKRVEKQHPDQSGNNLASGFA